MKGTRAEISYTEMYEETTIPFDFELYIIPITLLCWVLQMEAAQRSVVFHQHVALTTLS